MEAINVLQNKVKGTVLFDSVLGKNVLFERLNDNCIICSYGNHEQIYRSSGKVFNNADAIVVLAPSKTMKDWTKFSWKKGDVLSCGVDNFCIFDNWTNDNYTEFHAKYDSVTYGNGTYNTLQWTKVDNEKTIKQYISNIEEIKCGKLNLETLEIEPKPQFKNGDIVYVEGNRAIAIFKKSIKYEGFDYHACLYDIEEIEYDNFIITSNFRLATEEEKQQILSSLASIGKKWNPDTKQIENLPKKFKPFDKVLVRNSRDEIWIPRLFAYDGSDYFVCTDGDDYKYCIPYDGNEHLLGTTDEYKE